ncbi:hypothetical protein PS627_00134 [Pseudomonas fluorescens]|nr:hypothetical protein PS627_00134 [Pseudomonas fluorescens]
MRSVNKVFSPSVVVPLGRNEQPEVIVVGNPQESGYQALIACLQQQQRPVVCHESCDELQEPLLAKATVIFVLVGSFTHHALRMQIDRLIRRAGHISVIPIVEYAEQERAATLLENGCVDYLLAPFSPAQVSALLQRQEAAVAAQASFVACSHAVDCPQEVGQKIQPLGDRWANTQSSSNSQPSQPT